MATTTSMVRVLWIFLLAFAGRLDLSPAGPTITTTAAAAAAAVEDWAGSWTDTGDDGYGGTFEVCVDTAAGVAHGLYSELGYAHGQVMLVNGVATWSGRWFEAGQYAYGENWGFFSLQLSDDASSLNGTWAFGSHPTEFYPWAEDRISAAAPASDECWAAEIPNSASSSENTAAELAMNLQGSWADGATPDWWVCVEGNTFTSSYEYYSEGELTAGYITGDVVMNGRVLMGHWYEEEDRGIYLMVAGSDSLMRATWWAAADLESVRDDTMHDTETVNRVSTAVSSGECSRYVCITGGCQRGSSSSDDDDEDVIVAILAVCVALASLAVAGMLWFLYRAGVIGETHKHKHRRNSKASAAEPHSVQLKEDI